MANNTKEIKRRIKSVTNIGQITKAMELVSAAKMRKAQSQALASRPYATMSAELLRNLAAKSNLSRHPLIKRVIPEDMKLPAQKVLIVLISSDRGLAGAFNSNVINKAIDIVKAEGADKIDFISIGKKGSDALHRLNLNIIATFPAKDKGMTRHDAAPIAILAINGYLGTFPAEGGSASGGKYEKVFIVYTDFVSTLVQKPNMLQLLPFVEQAAGDSLQGTEDDFVYEPNADAILENLIVRTIEFAVFQTLVEAAASEHSARMVAMRNANEAASDLINELSLTYNQARQAGITRELSEISAAKLAMEG